jgi:hypothetical protein
VVIRDDASEYVHLHPMGSMSMATKQAFDLRNRGDTTLEGALNVPHVMDMNTKSRARSPRPVAEPDLPGRFSFPFAFPKPGRYRMWVQVRKDGRVQTADYEVTVRQP